jgi:hypothetical protein
VILFKPIARGKKGAEEICNKKRFVKKYTGSSGRKKRAKQVR